MQLDLSTVRFLANTATPYLLSGSSISASSLSFYHNTGQVGMRLTGSASIGSVCSGNNSYSLLINSTTSLSLSSSLVLLCLTLRSPRAYARPP